MTIRTRDLCTGALAALLVGCGTGATPDASPGRDAAPRDASANDTGAVVGDDTGVVGDDGGTSSDDADTVDDLATDPDADNGEILPPDDDGSTPPDDATPPPDASPGDGGGSTFAFPTPIHYLVVIVKENHTFDNYFTGFPGAETVMTARLASGATITRPEAPNNNLASDMSHSFAAGTHAYDDGRMDGFELTGTRPAGAPSNWNLQPYYYYPSWQIPNYWSWARQYVLFDHFFSTLLTQSDPGHTAIVAAQSPFLNNGTCPAGVTSCNHRCATSSLRAAVYETYNTTTCATTSHTGGCFNIPAFPNVLPSGVSWRAYGPGTGHSIYTPIEHIHGIDDVPATVATHYWDYNQFAADMRGGATMANVSVVDASSSGSEYSGNASEHPPNHPCEGENFTTQLVADVMASPHWAETAIVITWDDWGGWYDHVRPANDACPGTAHIHTGFRLPAIVISRWARGGTVDHDVTEQASIPRLIEDLFTARGSTPRRLHDISSTARDASAGSMMGAFDFTPGRTLVPDIHLATHTCASNGGIVVH